MDCKKQLKFLLPALALSAALAVGPGALLAQAGSATIRPTPADLEIGEGQVETLVIVLENAQDAYGIDVRGRFDPAAVEIIPAQPNAPLRAGGFIRPDFVAINAISNVSGTFRWAATQINPAPPATGSGPVILLQLRGRASGSVAAIEITAVDLANRLGEVLPVTRESGKIRIVATKSGVAAPGATPIPVPTSILTPGPMAVVQAAAPSAIPASAVPPRQPTTAGPTVSATPTASQATGLESRPTPASQVPAATAAPFATRVQETVTPSQAIVLPVTPASSGPRLQASTAQAVAAVTSDQPATATIRPAQEPRGSEPRDWSTELIGGVALMGLAVILVASRRRASKGNK